MLEVGNVEVPIAPLASYLFGALPELQDAFNEEIIDTLQIHALEGSDLQHIIVARLGHGYSNLTYLVRVGGRELVLRRPPVGATIATAHDMGREVKVLNGLGRVYEYVPRVLLYCEDPAIIGAPFYLMERLHGIVLRADEADRPAIAPEVMGRLAGNMIDNLAAIHALDYEAAGLADLGRPAGYVARQVQGWTKRYHAAQTEPQLNLERALRWLAEHQPADLNATQACVASKSSAAIIHNDYKYDNLMLDGDDLTRLVAVLDWEMCTLGDPLLDLGTTLGYWVEAGDPPALVEMFGLTTLPGNPKRDGVIERYIAASGRRDFDPLFYYVYGLTKIGVILQQIYHRYVEGKSQDQRFARLGSAVAACGLMATAAIRQKRVSGLF